MFIRIQKSEKQELEVVLQFYMFRCTAYFQTAFFAIAQWPVYTLLQVEM
jgi:hypothetical protein